MSCVRWKDLFWPLIVVMLAVASSSIEAQAVSPLPATVAARPASTSPVSVNLYDRLRSNAWDWYGDPPYTTTYPLVEQMLRVSVAQKVKKFDWLAELSSDDVFNVPNDAVSPVAAQGNLGFGGNYYAANANTLPAAVSFKQGYLRYHGAGADTTLRLGRFEFFDGLETSPKDSTVTWIQTNRVAQRLIGNFGFSNAQRSFDGVDGHLGRGSWDLSGMAGRATQGVFNMNANPELNVDIQYLAYSKYELRNHVLWRTFALDFHDGRTGVVKTDNRPLAVRKADHKNIRVGTYGADVIVAIPAGRGTFDGLFWGVLQNGNWGLLSQHSGAFAVEGGYRFNAVASRPWLRGGMFRGTGDQNASDTVHNTFFQVLPTARAYARFPFYDLMNSSDQFVQIVDNPTKTVELRSDLHSLQLTSDHDLWYQGGGAYDNKSFGFAGRPSAGHSSFASVVDLSADYKVTANLAMNLYYARSFGKSVVAADYPTRSSANYGYLELVYKWGVKQKAAAALVKR